ncbi:MAG: four helix bundle protein [Bacteroidota bacterium]
MENEHERPTTFFRFEDLRIYHKALDYIDWVYLMAKNTTDDPFMKLFFDRFLTSANGIALNIVEGSSSNRSHFVYYLTMVKRLGSKCVVESIIAKSRTFINAGAYDDSKNHLMEMTKMIGALIGSLQRSVKPGEHDEEEDE